MQREHLRNMACPECHGELAYESHADGAPTGRAFLRCREGGHSYPVVGGIPRFVDSEAYCSTFGFQWTLFSRVQLDSMNGSGFSEERFRAITGWGEKELRGRLVLDVGCGAGRFAEVAAAKCGARIVAVDLSNAVEACRDNLQAYDVLVCQASIFELPLRSASFDFVYCIGVIQHTPKPLEAIRCLCRMVRGGGQIALWMYELNWKCFVGTAGFKYALRPLIRRLPREKQLAFCRRLVDWCYPVARLAKDCGWPGKIAMRMLPVASAHLQSVNLRGSDFRTWVFLDTFDMYTPRYDSPQRFSSVARVLREEGFCDIERQPHGGIAVRATRRS